MSIPVIVESQNGTFTAAVLGAQQLRADGPTKDAAVAALRAKLSAAATRGELVFLNAPVIPPPVSEAEAEAIREMCAELYRERDEQKRREFPE